MFIVMQKMDYERILETKNPMALWTFLNEDDALKFINERDFPDHWKMLEVVKLKTVTTTRIVRDN